MRRVLRLLPGFRRERVGRLVTAAPGAVVDDNGHQLHPESFTAIGDELGKLYEALAARDVAAGSMAARRLFS